MIALSSRAGTVNDQNARPLVPERGIDREESIESGVFVTIGELSGLERHPVPMRGIVRLTNKISVR
jgi:hypothetical protein